MIWTEHFFLVHRFYNNTHIATKYGEHAYKKEQRKGKIDMNITVGGCIMSVVIC